MKLINQDYFRQAILDETVNLLNGETPLVRAVSRRRFLKLVGLVAVVYDPVVNTVGKIMSPGFEVQKSKGQVRFLINGQSQWEVAEHYFDGKARLQVETDQTAIRIKLKNAWFPATGLPADFECRIVKNEWGWRMAFSGRSFGKVEDVPFIPWLKGETSLESEAGLNQLICQFSPDEYIKLQGTAKSKFTADWALNYEAPGLVQLNLPSAQLANLISFQLNSFQPQSQIQKEDLDRETLISIQHPQGFRPVEQIDLQAHQSMEMPENAFQEILIEAGRNLQQETVYTLIQQGGPEPWSYCPDQQLKDINSDKFQVGLKNPVLVKSRKQGKNEFAFFASIDNKPTVLSNNGHYVTIDNSEPQKSSFEIRGSGGKVDCLHCTPTVKDYYIPIGNGMTMPISYGPGKRVFFHEEVEPELIKDESLLQVKKSNGSWHIGNDDQIFLPLIRKEDLTVLAFHYINFTLNVDKNALEQVPNKVGFISVYFPPQSIGERSYFYVSPGNSQNEFPSSLQIPYLLSGMSRLVFKVPPNSQPIELTVENMLKWENYELNIHPRAKAPSPQFQYGFQAFNPQDFQINTTTQISASRVDATSRIITEKSTSRQKIDFNTTKKPDRGRVTRPDRKPQRKPLKVPTDRQLKPIEGFVTKKNNNKKTQEALQSAVNVVPGITDIKPVFVDSYSEPRSLDTFIEAPFRLMISPNEKHAWINDTSPLNYNDPKTLADKNAEAGLNCGQFYEPTYYKLLPNLQVYELFHSRLARKSNKKVASPDYPLKMRAVWSKDANQDYLDVSGSTYKFRMSLRPLHRHNLVHMSSNFSIPGPAYNPATKKKTYNPVPFDVNRLFLTSLGATMDFYGLWPMELINKPAQLDVVKWIHQGSLGRDHYVRVVRAGFILPFRNQAVLIEITERKIEQQVAGKGPSAINRQRQFIVIREPKISYQNFQSQNFDYTYGVSKTRKVAMHFKDVTFKTTVTPNILDIYGNVANIHDQGAATAGWIMTEVDTPFYFNMKATDQDGQEVHFQSTGVWVSYSVGNGDNQTALNKALDKYNSQNTHPGNKKINKLSIAGQKMALAPSTPGKKGDTTYETNTILLGALNKAVGGTHFHPFLQEANAVVTSISELMDLDGGVDLIPHVESNGADLFAYVKSFVKMDFEEGADKGGGLATPNLDIKGLTKKLGPVGGVVEGVASKIMENVPKFDPAEFFQGVNPKLFGTISLLDILSALLGAEDAPKLLQEKLPDKIKIKYEWEPVLQNQSFPGFVFTPKPNSKLKLKSELTKPITAQNDATFSLSGAIEPFSVELFTVIKLSFADISFTSVNGKKPDVSCNFAQAPEQGIEFIGPLKWINALQELIPADGFYDPPILDIKPSGIDVGFTLALPDVASGVFALRNMKLSAILSLPLMGGNPLTFTFKFCEKHDPFNLTISFLGGGGFFGLTVNLSGMQRLEVLIEFGASLSIDLGVASGGVYVMAGIYFSMETVNDVSSTLFQGYIRMGGHLSVLGLISVSIEFHLSLNYQSTGNKDKVWGEASVKIKVEVLFFSTTVTAKAKRELKGAAADPTFGMLINKNSWIEYAQAFA